MMLIIVFIYLFPKIIICLYLLVSKWHYLFNFYKTKEGSNGALTSLWL